MKCVAILASCPSGGIGLNGWLPWDIPPDLEFFRSETRRTKDPTKRNAIVLGRRTVESMFSNPAATGLPGRTIVCVSRSPPPRSHVERADSVAAAISLVKEKFADTVETCFIGGGIKIYEEAFAAGLADEILWTRIGRDFKCDTFAAPPPADLYKVVGVSTTHTHGGVPYDFVRYRKTCADIRYKDWETVAGRGRHEEIQFLQTFDDFMTTGRATIALFEFDLGKAFPLLSTAKVCSWKKVLAYVLSKIQNATPEKENVCVRSNFLKIAEDLRGSPEGKEHVIVLDQEDPTSTLPLPLQITFNTVGGHLAARASATTSSCPICTVPTVIAISATCLRILAHVTNIPPSILSVEPGTYNPEDANRCKHTLGSVPAPFPSLFINPDKTRLDELVVEDFQLNDYHHHHCSLGARCLYCHQAA